MERLVTLWGIRRSRCELFVGLSKLGKSGFAIKARKKAVTVRMMRIEVENTQEPRYCIFRRSAAHGELGDSIATARITRRLSHFFEEVLQILLVSCEGEEGGLLLLG